MIDFFSFCDGENLLLEIKDLIIGSCLGFILNSSKTWITQPYQELISNLALRTRNSKLYYCKKTYDNVISFYFINKKYNVNV